VAVQTNEYSLHLAFIDRILKYYLIIKPGFVEFDTESMLFSPCPSTKSMSHEMKWGRQIIRLDSLTMGD
jgi:hypothetical protein